MYSWIKYDKVIVNYEYEGMLNEFALSCLEALLRRDIGKPHKNLSGLAANTGTCAHETDVLTNTVKGCVCTYIFVYNTSTLLSR